MLKHKVNAFLGTDLEHTLDRHGVEALTIVGSMSHMCIDAATRAAADLGYQVTVAHDACATLPLAFDGKQVPAAHVHDSAMAALAFAYADVVKTDELLKN
ncbi:Isochorismatase family protein YecD [compost metagenome]